MFEYDKKIALRKLANADKSIAGKIDLKIKSAVNAINSLPNNYTTSSCSGRITVFSERLIRSKKNTSWYLCSHSPIQLTDLKKILMTKLPKNRVCWFRFEGPIIHIASKSIDDARLILNKCELAGLRRSGIISLSKKIIIEVRSLERIESPIIINGKVLVSKNNINLLVKESNKKLLNSRKKINKFISLLMQAESKSVEEQ